MRLYNDVPAAPFSESLPARAATDWASLAKKQHFVLRDTYTFGCPRLGGKMKTDWAKNYAEALAGHTGKSWRIVNSGDGITRLPPIAYIPFKSKPWNHVDSGIEVFKDQQPTIIASEVGTWPSVDWHKYASWPLKTPHSMSSLQNSRYSFMLMRSTRSHTGRYSFLLPKPLLCCHRHHHRRYV